MRAVLRNVFLVSALGVFSFNISASETAQKDAGALAKDKKPVVEARTLDGKKPKACNFRISTS